MRIVTVSNTTMQPMVAGLPDHDVIVSGAGDLMSWLLDPSSPAAEPETDLVVVCPDGDSLLPPLAPEGRANELLDLVERFALAHPAKVVVVSTLAAGHRSVTSYGDVADPYGRFATRATWNARLAELASAYPNITILDLGGLAEQIGRDKLLTTSYWYLGRIRFTAEGFRLIARELGRIIAGALNQSRKVLVLDLDNTLWGGVIGEDGIGGIELSEEGAGKCFRDFQRHLKALRQAGTLLAIVSKNDPHVVDEVFDHHPMMALGREDFVSIDASWINKADRIRSLAETLSLGLDAFVFIDDNPVERDLVRAELPSVAVPEFPASREILPAWLVDEVVPACFPRFRVLEEDRAKTEQYRARQLRHTDQESDLRSFLASLDIRLTFQVDNEHLIPRISQLTQKTNQFNLTTTRLSPLDVGRLMTSSASCVIACDYSDRYGDEGTIGVAFVDFERAELSNLLLSCRVLGRGVEGHLLAEVERLARSHRLPSIRASYVPTDRNSVARDFLERSGYTLVDDGASWVGEKVIS